MKFLPIHILLFIALPLFTFAQWQQLGLDLDGIANADRYGISVDVNANGTRIAIGGDQNDTNGANAGHVRIFDWNGSAWTQVGTDINGAAAGLTLGAAVSLNADGDVLAIGATEASSFPSNQGFAQIYDWNGTNWVQRGLDIAGQTIGDNAGSGIDISDDGNVIIIGSSGHNGPAGSFAGHIRIYAWNGTAWVQRGMNIDGAGSSDSFGRRVRMSADGSVIASSSGGNDNANGSNAGHVRIFRWNGTAWVQQGTDLEGIIGGENFGSAIDIDNFGSTLVASSPSNGTNGGSSGQTRVFDWNGATWVQRGASINGLGGSSFFGSEVSISGDGNTFVASEPFLGAGKIRIFNWDGAAWIETQQIDGEASGDQFGTSLELSDDGSAIIVGAYANAGGGSSNAGHARVFNTCQSWPQIGMDLDGEATGDRFGIAVSLSGDGKRLASGGDWNDAGGMTAGHARVFEWDGTNWMQMDSDFDGTSPDGELGAAVSLNIDGNVFAVGEPNKSVSATGPGIARIYEWNGTAWIQRGADILGQATGDNCGRGISLNDAGDIVAIGSTYSNSYTGHVRVFQWNGAAWIQLGTDINGIGSFDSTGSDISLDAAGTTLAIPSSGNDNANGQNAGHVRVFEWNGAAWVQKGSDILGLNGGENAGSGVGLSANGNVLAVGAQNNGTNGGAAGQVRVYDWNGATWVQRGAGVNGIGGSSFFGSTVDISADGNTFTAAEPSISAGRVRIFDWDGAAWVQNQQIIGEGTGDQFGTSHELSDDGSTIAIGGYANAGNGTGAGHVRVFADGMLDLAVKVFLQGPLSGGLMSDNLRANNLIPTTDPYGLGENISDPNVLTVTGNDAIVDWVQIEIRDQADPTKIIQSTAALLQRDGDVVDVDGVSSLKFCGIVGGDYLIAVRHRNHLGVLSNMPVTIQ